jgi:DNA polymerase-3 subunit alpha
VLEALICAGAFDSLKAGHRAQLLSAIDSALDYAKAVHNGANSGMDSLFGGIQEAEDIAEPKLQDCPEWSEAYRLEKEKEYMNFYISGHPLNSYYPYINSLSTLKLGDKIGEKVLEDVRVCGMITEVRTRYDKRQKEIAFIKLEDFTGKAELIFWSDAFAKNKQHIIKDTVILCIGKAESDGEILKIIADEVYPIEEAASKFSKGYNIWVDLAKVGIEKIKDIHRLCEDSASKKMVVFTVFDRETKYKATYISDEVSISFSHKVVGRLGDLVGRQNVRLL